MYSCLYLHTYIPLHKYTYIPLHKLQRYVCIPLQYACIPLQYVCVPLQYACIPLQYVCIPLQFVYIPLQFVNGATRHWSTCFYFVTLPRNYKSLVCIYYVAVYIYTYVCILKYTYILSPMRLVLRYYTLLDHYFLLCYIG